MSKDTVEQALLSLGKTNKGANWQCPWHNDTHPSASIIQNKDGDYKLYCHTCQRWGDEKDILGEPYKEKAVMGFNTLEELMVTKPIPAEIYKYFKDGVLVGAIFRSENGGRKSFSQASLQRGQWVAKAMLKPSVLYHYDDIKNKKTVVVVEGEKACDALWRYGIPATTSAGGASNAKGADWSVLKGKNLILWPDNDEAGRKYMKQVESLAGCRVKWCEPNLPKKGDAWDFIDNAERSNAQLGGSHELTKKIIIDVLGDAVEKNGVQGLVSFIEGCANGTNVAVPFPNKELTRLTQALLPGTVTLVCGDPGASKSFMLLSWLIEWAKQGEKVSCFMLEDSKEETHLLRALAMMSGYPSLTYRDWIKDNPDIARQAAQEYSELLSTLDCYIDDAPDTQETLDSLCKWMEAKAPTSRILCIDPVTAASVGKMSQWEGDAQFILTCKKVAREHKCSVILVTHPKTGTKKEYSLESLAGGAAYPRFSHNVIWLEQHDPKDVTTAKKTIMGTVKELCNVNRTVHLMKARNGIGQGFKLGYNFVDLNFHECGIICKD